MSDYALGSTIYWTFTTRAFATGVPTALAGSPTLEIYENDSVTPIVEGASKLVLTQNLNSINGFNLATITATSGNGFEVGKTYHIIIKTGTVGGTSVVGEVVGRFTIEAEAALRPTTAGRTLDVSATGEAGVDWANVGSPTTTLALTGTTISTAQKVDLETIKTNPVVNAGTVTFPTTATLASTTNITAGTITTTTNLTNERGKYANGAVWIGPTANTNTVSYTDGIITNPVSTIAAAKTIADALNMRRFEVIRTGTVQIAASLAGYRLSGVGWSCTTSGGSQDVGTTAILGANVASGTYASTTGTINWEGCEFATGVSIGVSNLWECTFAGTTTLSTAGNYDFIDCASIVAGTAAPIFAVPAGVTNISFRRWSGGIKLTGLTADTTVSIDVVSGGTVTLEGTGATVVVRGMATGVTNSMAPSAGTVTTTAVCNQTVLATPTNITAGTITTVSGNVTGSVGSVTGLTAADVGAIKTKTDYLPSATAGAAGGVFIAGSNAATSITTALTANIVGDITGNLSGSVGSVTAEVDVGKINGTTILGNGVSPKFGV